MYTYTLLNFNISSHINGLIVVIVVYFNCYRKFCIKFCADGHLLRFSQIADNRGGRLTDMSDYTITVVTHNASHNKIKTACNWQPLRLVF